ncbi:TPA: hypothetical protein HA361_03190 [Candidatus Woesearchaeota archaeon]|nr:hypothetical protein [Candidatus Woesearchaeota archaeon]HII69112.1 hypothetical protein [Candidatus Woesearchaeota archaeon]
MSEVTNGIQDYINKNKKKADGEKADVEKQKKLDEVITKYQNEFQEMYNPFRGAEEYLFIDLDNKTKELQEEYRNSIRGLRIMPCNPIKDAYHRLITYSKDCYVTLRRDQNFDNGSAFNTAMSSVADLVNIVDKNEDITKHQIYSMIRDELENMVELSKQKQVVFKDG